MKFIDNEPENSESSAENGAESYDTGESLAPNEVEAVSDALIPGTVGAHSQQLGAHNSQITRLTEHVRMICDHFHLPHTL